MVQPCSAAGCTTLTMGLFCLVHETVADDPVPVRSRRVATAALVGATAGLLAAYVARAKLSL